MLTLFVLNNVPLYTHSIYACGVALAYTIAY